MDDEILEREFPVGARPELSVTNISGRVDVRAGEGSSIRLRATKTGSPQAVENTRIECTHDGNRVSVKTRGEIGGLLNLARNVSSVDYDLVVPRDCEVQVEAVGAEVRIQGISAAVHLRTVGGDVDLQHLTGECHVTTVSGDVTGAHLSGALSLRTTSGDARITESQLSHFNLNSVSGDFWIETPLSAGQHYLAKTVSGDLRLLVPPSTGATVQMKSVSGDVESDLRAEIIKAGKRHWQGRINGGGANVEVNSVSGELRIAQVGASPTPVASPAIQGAPLTADVPETTDLPSLPDLPDLPELEVGGMPAEGGSKEPVESETSTVLKALERGEISVEDAIARLDALK